jgi:hypothetical protein
MPRPGKAADLFKITYKNSELTCSQIPRPAGRGSFTSTYRDAEDFSPGMTRPERQGIVHDTDEHEGEFPSNVEKIQTAMAHAVSVKYPKRVL